MWRRQLLGIRDFIAAPQRAGVDVLNNADVQALNGNGCAGRIFGQLRPLDCDTAFINMMTGVAQTP